MADPQAFDFVVIGAGPAGVTAAITAAGLGKSVALVEKKPAVGGAALNTGTVPSKTLRETALAFSGLRTRNLYGVDLSLRRECTVADLLRHERAVRDTEQARWAGLLGRYGVHAGHRRRRDSSMPTRSPRAARTANAQSPAKFIVIAIGSSPVRPPLFPFEHPRVHDSDEIVNLEVMPESLAVVGAGVVGSEYACTFAALGVPVHVIDGRDCLLPFLDLEIAQALTTAMTALGVVFHWKEQVIGCDAPGQGDIRLKLLSGAELLVDAVLVAVGRESRTADLNPEAAGLLVGQTRAATGGRELPDEREAHLRGRGRDRVPGSGVDQRRARPDRGRTRVRRSDGGRHAGHLPDRHLHDPRGGGGRAD